MIKNPKFGLGYSSSRFTQYLLNLGHRRNHFHSYLCKTALGGRADLDSEDWDVLSADEELVATGPSDPNLFDEVESDDEYEQPAHVLAATGAESVVGLSAGMDAAGDVFSDYGEEPPVANWADEVAEAVAGHGASEEFEAQTAAEYTMWSDDESRASSPDNTGVADNADNEAPTNTRIPIVTTTESPVSDKPAFDATKINDMFAGINFDDVFGVDSSDGSEAEHGEVDAAEAIGDIFSKAIKGTYEKIKDVKDKGLKSEKSGHTVNPTLENPRAIVKFVKDWLDTVGAVTEFDEDGVLSKDVSSITGMYLTMHKAGVLQLTNPLEQFYGMDNMRLPISLSAMAIIGTTYY